MSEIAIHSRTLNLIDNYKKNPTVPLLLAGPQGIGKSYLSYWIISSISDYKIEDLVNNPNLLSISPIKGIISVEQIRDIKEFIKLKPTDRSLVNRFILIEHADKMGKEAQNALLKILEEPPDGTLIILTTDYISNLLKTLISRCYVINVLIPPKPNIEAIFSNNDLKDTTFSQFYNLTGGMPGIFKALVDNSSDQPLIKSLDLAKKILGSEVFDRLILVDEIIKNKINTIQLVEVLIRIADTGIIQAASKNSSNDAKRWLKVLNVSYEALDKLNSNVNTKLALTYLMLNV